MQKLNLSLVINKAQIMRTLKPNADESRRQVKQYVQQCGFPKPLAVDDIITFYSIIT
jgi:hypothetical protein